MLVHNNKERDTVITKILAIDLVKQPWDISAEPHKKTRSIAQNALLYSWYAAIAKHTGEGIAYTRGRYKWEAGVPILLARGEPEFDTLINAIVDKMTYEQIIELFGTDKISITSVMKVTEFTDYLTFIEQDCATRQIPLLKGDEYDLAMGVKRLK